MRAHVRGCDVYAGVPTRYTHAMHAHGIVGSSVRYPFDSPQQLVKISFPRNRKLYHK